MVGNTIHGIRIDHIVVHQEINISHLDHRLPYLMQCRIIAVTINNTPNFFTNSPTPQTHDIVVNIKDSDAEIYNLILPLILKVMKSYLPIKKTTE